MRKISYTLKNYFVDRLFFKFKFNFSFEFWISKYLSLSNFIIKKRDREIFWKKNNSLTLILILLSQSKVRK